MGKLNFIVRPTLDTVVSEIFFPAPIRVSICFLKGTNGKYKIFWHWRWTPVCSFVGRFFIYWRAMHILFGAAMVPREQRSSEKLGKKNRDKRFHWARRISKVESKFFAACGDKIGSIYPHCQVWANSTTRTKNFAPYHCQQPNDSFALRIGIHCTWGYQYPKVKRTWDESSRKKMNRRKEWNKPGGYLTSTKTWDHLWPQLLASWDDSGLQRATFRASFPPGLKICFLTSSLH